LKSPLILYDVFFHSEKRKHANMLKSSVCRKGLNVEKPPAMGTWAARGQRAKGPPGGTSGAGRTLKGLETEKRILKNVIIAII